MNSKYHKNIEDMTYNELLNMIGCTKKDKERIMKTVNKIPERWHGN